MLVAIDALTKKVAAEPLKDRLASTRCSKPCGCFLAGFLVGSWLVLASAFAGFFFPVFFSTCLQKRSCVSRSCYVPAHLENPL